MEREACVCDHGFERSDLCAEIIIIIITITVWEVRAAPGFYLPANLSMEFVENTAEPYTVLHLSVLSRIGFPCFHG